MTRLLELVRSHPKTAAVVAALVVAASAALAWRLRGPSAPAPAPAPQATANAQAATQDVQATSSKQVRRGAARAVHTQERDPKTGAVVKDEVRIECEDSSRQAQQGSSSSSTSSEASAAAAVAPPASAPARTRLRLAVGPEWNGDHLQLRPDVPLEAAARPFAGLPVEVYGRVELRDASVREIAKGTQFGARVVLEWP